MADDPRTDAQLTEAIRDGDRRAFESLYLRHRDWAFRVARRYAPDDALAMDSVQEAFLYLHRKGRGLRLTARFTTFLYPVLRHEAQRAARRARRDNASPPAAAPELGAGSPASLGDEADGILRRALDALPGAQREVLLMHAVDGMTHGEIAVALSIPLGTVKSRLHAALTTLRSDERLGEYFE